MMQITLFAALLFSVAFAQIESINGGEPIVYGDDLPPGTDDSDTVSKRASYEYGVGHAWVQDVVDLVNAERASGANCGVYGNYAATTNLILSPALTVAAMEFGQEKCAYTYYSGPSPANDPHRGHDDSTAGDRINRTNFSALTNLGCYSWGENVARGYSSPSAVVTAWMNSDGHCKNIMNPYTKFIGVGIADCPSGGLHWVQKFMGGWDNVNTAGVDCAWSSTKRNTFNANDNLSDITLGAARDVSVAARRSTSIKLNYSVGYGALKTKFVVKTGGVVVATKNTKPTDEWNAQVKFGGLQPSTKYKFIMISQRKGVPNTKTTFTVKTKA